MISTSVSLIHIRPEKGINMFDDVDSGWQDRVVDPNVVLSHIEPGMSLFLGTGVAEPRTLVKHLKQSDMYNLTDLELVQIVSLGDVITLTENPPTSKYRLKTFFAGWLANNAILSGSVDMIPCRFSQIPWLVQTGAIRIDAAFVQITPPDKAGFSSLGMSIDIARYAIQKASLVVGEINSNVPRTMGDTFVNIADFDYLINATEPPIYFPRWQIDDVMDRVSANVASLIDDGSCLSFYPGALFEGLANHLLTKHDLGIHTLFVTDALMDLIKSGVVTNRNKSNFRNKSVTSYALGTQELMKWLHRNPLIEFQEIAVVSDNARISANDKTVFVMPARKVDLMGGVALHIGKGNVTAGPGHALEFYAAAQHSRGGRAIFALPSRNLDGIPNILPSVEDFPNQFSNRESLDFIVTEYGVASMIGRTVRERAQALIDIAHPDDRAELVKKAKEAHILYPDQIYLPGSGALYPHKLSCINKFKGDLTVGFRAIKPSDEEEMRKLFYRFSDSTVYYRFFSHVETMPHKQMQQYVNIDYQKTLSIVATVTESGRERIIGEGRYVRLNDRPSWADLAFVVEEGYQGKGIASQLLKMLIQAALEQGIECFTADVLYDNKPMLKVFEKISLPINAVMKYGVYNLTIPLKSS